ncbi:MAG TPA: HU family DNA-binding protein [Ktedonosporobacter sp.]|nr:HU family DNA-binding protein [Ktedonosporobacter sp.]
MKTSTADKTQNVVSKDELIHQIAAKAGLNLKSTSKVIDAFTEVVREDVAKGHEVRLMGFGTWNLRSVAARRVKSIRGGKQITLPARKRVGFSVGAVLAQAASTGKTASASAAKTTPSQPARPMPSQPGRTMPAPAGKR